MDQFKLFHDRVLTAQGEVDSVRNAINQALALGTPEGEEQALTLEAMLDAAVANEKKWHDFYDKVIDSAKTKNPLARFVPVEGREIPDEEKSEKVINRAGFDALDPAARTKFVNAGGKVTDEKE